MRFKQNTRQVAILLAVMMLTTFIACNSGDSQERYGDIIETEIEEVEKEVKTDQTEETVFYMLPSALQIAHIYRKSGLKYFPNLTSEIKNVDKYVTETSKLQNLGVYSADLCYVALNKQTQEQLYYLKAMMDMSGDLGFSSVFSSGAFVDRFENNMESEDSMIVILSQLQQRLDYYLEDGEMEDKSTIIFSGAWIESIYVSLTGFRMEGEGSGASIRIHEQLNILSSLIGKLEKVWQPDDKITGMIEDLKAMRTMVESFDFMEEVDKESHVLLKNVTMSEKELDQLEESVREIRTKIING
ncbi:MAG TPA: hypothetical protein EYN51_11945 [Flavobacteriales bacterium]|nr:hypothetical protein [Flavobacteriales bacterium]